MKRRRRKRVRPAPMLALLLIANVAIGLAYSSLTSLTKVRIVGAEPFDRPRLEEQMASLAGVSALQVDPRRVESEALLIPEALDADFHRSLFGRGLLKISYRRPVARVEGSNSVLLDENGVLYHSRQVAPNLIGLKLPPEVTDLSLTFQTGWPCGELAHLAINLPKTMLAENPEIELLPKGELCLNNSKTGKVVFGSAAQLDEKLGRLKTLLSQNPRLLSDVAELNLTAPDHPSLIPLAVEKKS